MLDGVTVFGGTGFLGRALVRTLAQHGYRVRIAARRPRAPEGVAPERIELCTTDIRDSASIDRALNGSASVINSVSLYVEPRTGPTFEAIHVQAARRLARRAQEAGVERLLHVSGVGAHPEARARYIHARGAGEERVREAYPEATILRPTVLFGPGDAFLQTLDAVTRAPVVPLFGDGSTRLQPVHVDDIAAAAERMLARPETAGSTFELGGGAGYSYRDIVGHVLAQRRRRRPMLPIPFGAWRRLAQVLARLPSPPLTPDQVELMALDNVADSQAHGFTELDITPRSLEDALAASLDRGTESSAGNGA